MAKVNRFMVIDEHIKLLEGMYVGWNDCEFGAPEISPKRPYGNSSVLTDMREIIDDEYSDAQLRSLHEDMDTVLRIMIDTKQISTGEYTRTGDGSWERVDAKNEYLGLGPSEGLEENSIADELFADIGSDECYEVSFENGSRYFEDKEIARAFCAGLEQADDTAELTELGNGGESNE